MRLIDVLLGRKEKPDTDRDAEMNALQVKSDKTLERVERLVRLAGIDAHIGAQGARRQR